MLQFLILQLFVLIFFSKYCFADLEIDPNILVAESYVASTAAVGFNEGFITTAQPGVAANYSGRDFSILSDYKLTNRSRLSAREYYDVSHQYSVDSALKLFRERISLSAAYDFGQRIDNPLGTLNIDNRISNGNRINRSSSRLEAAWSQPINRIALGEMRYSLAQNNSASQTLSRTRVDNVFLSLSNGIWFKRLFWKMEYSGMKYDNVSYNTPASQSLIGLFGYSVLHNVDVSLTGGYEINPRFTNIQQNQSEGTIALATLSWRLNRKVLLSGTYGRRSFGESYIASLQIQPSRRLNLSASLGKSVIGSTFEGQLSHQLRRASWFLLYNERLVSLAIPVEEQSSGFFTDETGGSVFSPDAPSFADIIFPVVRNGFFIRRIFTLGSQLTGRKNVLRFNLNHTRREFEGLNFEDKGYGGGASWSLSLGRRGLFELNAESRRTSFADTTRAADILRLGTRYTHTMGKQVSINGLYYYLERKSSDITLSQQQHVVRVELSASY